MTRPLCPVCKKCPFAGGVCEDRVNRGRRFFLMGALAVPIARKIEDVGKLIVPAAPSVPKIEDLLDMNVPHPDIALLRLQEAQLRDIYHSAGLPIIVSYASTIFVAR